ncbi:nucleotidyltransferase domain-containing protein [Azospirillum sp. RWY-5-1]|uniref:Nucleotidyltransferase domain-containing protein n=1 Tax=Azospirillum oleiclasticum TaxID=2735135 RepID=A0ABX2T8K3_9PROT|nr:nucleotidyltransferase domain-containing protein [Azospirillum oleiclasticum]NYZ12422.1 nucleotidyltransferase domain-containing protein [Azospirillum oleiclasticum]NYZ19582.1 nucleotidyltransferase domain-containing protein [Azospirillum oleiclasticum]
MRLTPDEQDAIRRTAAAVFGADAVVRLFGSRVDDARRGGDIDLHIETAAGRATFDNEARFLHALEGEIGERRVDFVVRERGGALRPIDRLAMETGMVL